ncbi:hypothetical protein SCHPADRAFT_940890 [Schizopora paradoxa]|uniref:Uncharacterized protein n=1 Tax=Schizopora paradoxa TaxID=27342 RepID=A0A0H2S7H4_9AGAM|nr:hypothetical protein SCHPADRAFT_940890 [Schizopora paradoxa]
MASSGLRSPAPVPDAAAAAARPSFDSEQLTAYIKALLDSTLSNAISGDSGRYASWCSEIGSRVKERMLQMQPNGYKYIVITRIDDYKDQTIHAHMKGLWEDGDVVVKERYQNDEITATTLQDLLHRRNPTTLPQLLLSFTANRLLFYEPPRRRELLDYVVSQAEDRGLRFTHLNFAQGYAKLKRLSQFSRAQRACSPHASPQLLGV